MRVVERHLDNLLHLTRTNLLSTTYNIYADLANYNYDVVSLRNTYRTFFLAIPLSYLTSIDTLVIPKHTQLFTAPDYYSPYLFDHIYNFNWTDNTFRLTFRYNRLDRPSPSLLEYGIFSINRSTGYVYLPVFGHKLLTNAQSVQFIQNALLSQNIIQFVLDDRDYYLVDLISDFVGSSGGSIRPKALSNIFLTDDIPTPSLNIADSRRLSLFSSYRSKFEYISTDYPRLTRIIRDGILYILFNMVCTIYDINKQIVNVAYIKNKVDIYLFTRLSIIKPIFKLHEQVSRVITPAIQYRTLLPFLDMLEVDVIVGPTEQIMLV